MEGADAGLLETQHGNSHRYTKTPVHPLASLGKDSKIMLQSALTEYIILSRTMHIWSGVIRNVVLLLPFWTYVTLGIAHRLGIILVVMSIIPQTTWRLHAHRVLLCFVNIPTVYTTFQCRLKNSHVVLFFCSVRMSKRAASPPTTKQRDGRKHGASWPGSRMAYHRPQTCTRVLLNETVTDVDWETSFVDLIVALAPIANFLLTTWFLLVFNLLTRHTAKPCHANALHQRACRMAQSVERQKSVKLLPHERG